MSRTSSFGLALPLAVCAAVLAPAVALAFPGVLDDWQARYGALSPSGEAAACQLCHASDSGGPEWNAYGWDVVLALDDPACDLDASGDVSHAEAFYCVDDLNSDLDGSDNDNLTEIGAGTQPGWTNGPNNTLTSLVGQTFGASPPGDIGAVDPEGTAPPPVVEPPPPGGEPLPPVPPGSTIFVRAGESIQAAIDRVSHDVTIRIEPGVYRELADPTNGLQINQSGLRLIGESDGKHGVVLMNAGNQRNGIVVVPDDRNDCMSCHVSMEPPFELHPYVEPGFGDPTPVLHDVEIEGITIQNFRNNGLFTERVDGFRIVHVRSIDNKNYGIFPTLSRNGLIKKSYATGADDSGIWVETSQNVLVQQNLVENNVNGFELSNSDDVEFSWNTVRNNTVGFAVLLLPDIFDERPGAKRITIRRNKIYLNNRPNTARPGSILATVPRGIGVLHLGVDDSLISDNYIAANHFIGVAVVDYCLVVLGTPFACDVDPSVTPEFVADSAPSHNQIRGNNMIANGNAPDPGPFAFAASDFALVTLEDEGNCYQDNQYQTAAGTLPPCEPEEEGGPE